MTFSGGGRGYPLCESGGCRRRLEEARAPGEEPEAGFAAASAGHWIFVGLVLWWGLVWKAVISGIRLGVGFGWEVEVGAMGAGAGALRFTSCSRRDWKKVKVGL